jgi:hypothetical protein
LDGHGPAREDVVAYWIPIVVLNLKQVRSIALALNNSWVVDLIVTRISSGVRICLNSSHCRECSDRDGLQELKHSTNGMMNAHREGKQGGERLLIVRKAEQ